MWKCLPCPSNGANGEFNPLPQTRRQRQTETAEGLHFKERLNDLSEASAGTLGMDRRQFLRTSLPRLFVGYRRQPTLVKERLCRTTSSAENAVVTMVLV